MIINASNQAEAKHDIYVHDSKVNTHGLRYFIEGPFSTRVIQMYYWVPIKTIKTARPK